jgi:hypothetical protein
LEIQDGGRLFLFSKFSRGLKKLAELGYSQVSSITMLGHQLDILDAGCIAVDIPLGLNYASVRNKMK